jgi:hypothetical protein
MSIVFEATVDVSGFKEWAEDSTLYVIERMKSTLLEVSMLIENNTNPLVPYKTGLLESSYMEAIHTADPIVELEIGYSAASSGWDYALIQHEQYPVKRLRGHWFYLSDGIERSRGEAMVMIEKDYLTALRGR